MSSYPNPSPDNHSVAKAWFQRNIPDGFVLNRVWRIENTNGSRWQVAYTSTRIQPIIENSVKCRKLFTSRFPSIFKYVTIISNECEDSYWCVTFGKQKVTFGQFLKTQVFSSRNRQPDKKIVSDIPTTTSGLTNGFKLLVTTKSDKTKSLVSLNEYDEDIHYPTRLISAGVNVTKKYTGRCTLTTSLWHRIRDMLHQRAYVIRETVKKYLQTRSKRISFVPATEEIKSEATPTQHNVEVKTVKLPVKEVKSYSAVAYQYSDYTKNIIYSKFADEKHFLMVRKYIISGLGFRGYGTIDLDLRPEHSKIELANYLLSNGLPLDESLRTYYFDYCKDHSLVSDAEAELLQYAMKHKKIC